MSPLASDPRWPDYVLGELHRLLRGHYVALSQDRRRVFVAAPFGRGDGVTRGYPLPRTAEEIVALAALVVLES